MRQLLGLLLTAGLLTFVPATARSAPITWQFSGAVDDVTGLGWSSIALGSPFSYVVTFDPSTTGLSSCPPGSGLYPAIQSATLTIGQLSWVGGLGFIEVNAPDGNCLPASNSGVSFRQFNWSGPAAPLASPFEVVSTLYYPASLTAGVGTMPSALPLSALVQVNGPIRGVGGPSSLTTVTPVPEPATLWLVATGGAIAARRFLKKRRA